MLLGCCHCGPIESQASVPLASVQSAPSGFNPSELYGSQSNVSVLPPNVNPVCAACYNFPVKWTVDFNQSWWTFNPGGGLGFPTFTDCPSSIATQSYLLRYSGITGVPEGSGSRYIYFLPSCAVWKSDEYAIDVTARSCTGKPTFPLCATDIFKRPRVALYAFAWNTSSTLFVMTYSWAVCQYIYTHEWRWWVTRPGGDTISCVRQFNAEFYTVYDTFDIQNGPHPYYLAGATNPGKNILVSPA